jgi:hypothetical protein
MSILHAVVVTPIATDRAEAYCVGCDWQAFGMPISVIAASDQHSAQGVQPC